MSGATSIKFDTHDGRKPGQRRAKQSLPTAWVCLRRDASFLARSSRPSLALSDARWQLPSRPSDAAPKVPVRELRGRCGPPERLSREGLRFRDARRWRCRCGRCCGRSLLGQRRKQHRGRVHRCARGVRHVRGRRRVEVHAVLHEPCAQLDDVVPGRVQEVLHLAQAVLLVHEVRDPPDEFAGGGVRRRAHGDRVRQGVEGRGRPG
mmetsp:Transcript_66159/g.132750  ORF Transcript_66159/g.132750 Transcript_66159/m.132750 type:complete len:206 (+) Transcript_66159:120-737(+)